ncbi:MAG: flagellar motor protein MotB [Candidatus Liberibacter europaeus]|uniref:Flagellar motor protein MotB n=1 Tax=Candidatus Liberibacter europaeus TaxID=744859 RepID=A0A2T4VXI7_9HYPH|nr:flagellar motor protein MotB [Candidatus Liberibacter europaeus]PTL86478.1 MAG: flagellar motor protein MotB [Candidatus Liberibacter europaeus]
MKRIAGFDSKFFVIFLFFAFVNNGCQYGNRFAGTSSAKLEGVSVDMIDMQKEFTYSAGEGIFFDESSYVIRPEDIHILSSIGSWLESHDCDFVIAGHTDGQGTRNYNMVLGFHRARMVYNYLLARGIPSSRMKTTSYGKELPISLGLSENSYAKNRRAVVILKRCR